MFNDNAFTYFEITRRTYDYTEYQSRSMGNTRVLSGRNM